MSGAHTKGTILLTGEIVETIQFALSAVAAIHLSPRGVPMACSLCLRVLQGDSFTQALVQITDTLQAGKPSFREALASWEGSGEV